MLCGMYQISEQLSRVQKLQQELRQRKQVSEELLTMLLKNKYWCDGSAHSSGCVVNGSNAMAAV